MQDYAAIITAAGGVLVSIGAAGRFVWHKISARMDDIDRKLDECEYYQSMYRTVVELLWQEVSRVAPDSTVLKRAKKLMDELKRGDGK
jgi:hypothetical protein